VKFDSAQSALEARLGEFATSKRIDRVHKMRYEFPHYDAKKSSEYFSVKDIILVSNSMKYEQHRCSDECSEVHFVHFVR
jgi:hypothetical protein